MELSRQEYPALAVSISRHSVDGLYLVCDVIWTDWPNRYLSVLPGVSPTAPSLDCCQRPPENDQQIKCRNRGVASGTFALFLFYVRVCEILELTFVSFFRNAGNSKKPTLLASENLRNDHNRTLTRDWGKHSYCAIMFEGGVVTRTQTLHRIFELPWRRIVTSTETLAQSHETLAREIEVDVERPLREYTSKNSDVQAMSSAHQDLMGLAKELETAQKRAAKPKAKPGRSSAAATAVDDAKAQWDSRAPFVFEKLQAIDEHRIDHLRDVLTQFQTHEADQIERNRQSTEGCLNALLNLQSADEIKTFAAKISGGRSTGTEDEDNQTAVAAAVTAASEDLPPPPKIQGDAASQHSNGSKQGRPSMSR